MQEGLNPKEAAIQAMQDVTGAVIATTLEIYQQFAVTLSTAVIFSTVCALTLSPALCTVLLRNRPADRKKFVLFRLFDAVLDRVGRVYVWASGVFARHVVLLSLVFLLLVFWAVATAKSIPQAFIPHEDQGTVMVDANLPEGCVRSLRGR